MKTANTRGIKIAIVASSSPPMVSGGISSAHYNLYLVLKRTGLNVKLFTYTDHASTRAENGVMRHGTASFLLKAYKPLTWLYNQLVSRGAGAQCSLQLPYVLESAWGALQINASLSSFRPNILILPDNGAPGFFIKKSNGCRSIFISHHNPLRFIDDPLLGKFLRSDTLLTSCLERITLKKVDKVICPSLYMKDVFERTHRFRGPIAVIPNIVDAELIASLPARDLRQDLLLPHDAPVIYIPSAGSAVKGSRYVFEIIRRMAAAWGREIGFYLSGGVTDDAQRRELEFIPSNAKVYNPGYIDYFENISIVKGCSLCVSPALLESFGMAILEANFCGLPVVTFAVGGNVDVIHDGVNGFLAPVMDIEKLISLSIGLLDEEVRREMGLGALKLVRDKFKSENIGRQYIEFILDGKL